MAELSELHISGLRNLDQQSLKGLSRLNVISGPNGSGKTSILEAIHLLALAKSFRTRDIRQVINHNDDNLVVSAKGIGDSASLPFNIGVQRFRSKQATQAKINGEVIRSAHQLGECLAISLLDSNSFRLVESGPSYRREFVDWFVFHVKQQEFAQPWSRYRKSLQQRNSLLKSRSANNTDIEPWTREIVAQGDIITRLRINALSEFGRIFKDVASKYVINNSQDDFLDYSLVDLNYNQGWSEGESLQLAMDNALNSDIKYGATSVGPHRADLIFTYGENKQRVDQCFSRGQIKMFICLLKLAQSEYLNRKANRKSIYLLDDLPSELDDEAIAYFIMSLSRTSSQVFITTIRDELIQNRDLFSGQTMFHVKHGVVSRQS